MKKINIGCFSGFWGDSSSGAFQLVQSPDHIDYLVGDYLAEVTMGILARMKAGKGGSEGGHIAEFGNIVWEPLLKEIIAKKIKVITNAGGMNPNALKNQLEAIAKKQGYEIMIAAIEGDNLTNEYPKLKEQSLLHPFEIGGEIEDLPKKNIKVLSCNSYLGGFPVADALAKGAQVVVTGRIVDSALVLGPLIHEFGWKSTDYDLLGSGSIVGHIIECGCQATGGNFTDWELSARNGWHDVGFPIAECFPDGTAIITKPQNTGGLVSLGTVSEQLLYEILDPANYVLPDVIADFTGIQLKELQKDSRETPGRILVTGGKGKPPTPWYKASVTGVSGFKSEAVIMIAGSDARKKALTTGEGIIKKCRQIFKTKGHSDFREVNIETLGSEYYYGANSRTLASREILLRLTVTHQDPKALDIFGREVIPSALSMSPGISGSAAGRPQPKPNLLHFACLIDKKAVDIHIILGKEKYQYHPILDNISYDKQSEEIPQQVFPTICYKDSITVPLIKLCYGRSGDKGDIANIGIICRDQKFFSVIHNQVTSQVVKEYLQHLLKGKVIRYTLPGVFAFNFVCTKALGGGGLASLNMDRQGKCYAQVLLDLPVTIPSNLLPPQAKI